MIHFVRMGVIQLKKLIVLFTGYVSNTKAVQSLKCVNYINYLRNDVTLKYRKRLIFVLSLTTFSKSKSLIDKENKSRFSYLWSKHFTYVN